MDQIMVSVITPTRGRPLAVRRAMESVRAQTLNQVEHIVLGDDCPAIDQPDVREALVHEFPTAHVENLPPDAFGTTYRPARTARVRNHGIDLAHGRFIAHLDDDNAFEPDHLATLAATLAGDPDAVAAHSWRRLLDPAGNPYVPAGVNPWIADPEDSARNYSDLADSGVFRRGSNIMRDRLRGRHGQPFLLVDTSELMVRADFHRAHQFRTEYAGREMASGLCEDRAWCLDVVGSGHRIVPSGRVTLRYTMGGYSNGPADAVAADGHRA